MISLLGIPYDASSSFMRGPAQAPEAIREALLSPSANLSIENGMMFEFGQTVTDLGNVDFRELDFESESAGTGRAIARERITASVLEALKTNRKLISLGGDHSVTYPILQALAPQYDRLTIVQFDAHPDLHEDFEGDRYSHACPFARILEEFSHVSLIQIGIRTLNQHCRSQAERFGVEVYEMANLPELGNLRIEGPAYISLDLDVLDPAYAPGISHHEPGGMSVRDVITQIHRMDAEIIGADLVELNPTRDINGVSAMVAAKLTRELAGKLLETPATR
jgi:agmatinase